MSLEIETKESDPKSLILKWNGDFWREVDRSLFLNGLKTFPKEISQEEFLRLFHELELRAAKILSLRFLSRKARMSKELGEKLRLRGISQNAIEHAVAYCQERGFLNDEEYARALMAREQRKGLGKKMILYKLKAQKKVDDGLLKQIAEDMAPEKQVLAKWLQKCTKNVDLTDRKAKQNVIAKCIRRGFSYSEVIDALRD